MKRSSQRAVAALLVCGSIGCSRSLVQSPPVVEPVASAPAQPKASGTPKHSAADVHFIQGMIPHHAQAVKMALWAPTHGASSSLRILCERIVVGQTDEITLMRQWLSDRGERVPAADATHHKMVMDGMEHDMLMPGMLTDQELAQLDAARGVEFDRLFLTFMIKHHLGAVQMVDELNASYAAAQDDLVFRLSSGIYADQTTEVDRMQKMLAALPPPAGRAP